MYGNILGFLQYILTLLQAYAQTKGTVSHIGQNIQEVFEETFIFFIAIGFEIIVVETIPPFQQLILVV